MDTAGRVIVFQEKTSILLTIGMVLAILGVVGIFGMAALAAAYSVEAAAVLAFQGLVALIYVFILNHLRKKGDMNVSSVVIPTAYGGAIEVHKKSSIWITLALVFAVLGIIGSIGIMGYGFIMYATLPEVGTSMIVMGLIGIIAGALYAAILNFLRTKIDFPGDRVILRTTAGYFIELYKSKSIWLTIGMVFTLLGAIALIGLGALAIVAGSLAGPPQALSYYPGEVGPADMSMAMLPMYGIGGMYAGIMLILMGLLLLINVAVLNFLRVRGHVRPAQGGHAPQAPPAQYPVQQPPPAH